MMAFVSSQCTISKVLIEGGEGKNKYVSTRWDVVCGTILYRRRSRRPYLSIQETPYTEQQAVTVTIPTISTGITGITTHQVPSTVLLLFGFTV
jgi:hypothetical protein